MGRESSVAWRRRSQTEPSSTLVGSRGAKTDAPSTHVCCFGSRTPRTALTHHRMVTPTPVTYTRQRLSEWRARNFRTFTVIHNRPWTCIGNRQIITVSYKKYHSSSFYAKSKKKKNIKRKKNNLTTKSYKIFNEKWKARSVQNLSGNTKLKV